MKHFYPPHPPQELAQCPRRTSFISISLPAHGLGRPFMSCFHGLLSREESRRPYGGSQQKRLQPMLGHRGSNFRACRRPRHALFDPATADGLFTKSTMGSDPLLVGHLGDCVHLRRKSPEVPLRPGNQRISHPLISPSLPLLSGLDILLRTFPYRTEANRYFPVSLDTIQGRTNDRSRQR